jgi:hypothetical protein
MIASSGTAAFVDARHLSIEPVTVRDFNGPDCDYTVYNAAAEPVVVPASARLAGE